MTKVQGRRGTKSTLLAAHVNCGRWKGSWSHGFKKPQVAIALDLFIVIRSGRRIPRTSPAVCSGNQPYRLCLFFLFGLSFN